MSNNATVQMRNDATAITLVRRSHAYAAEAAARRAWSREDEAHRYDELAAGYALAATVLARHDRDHLGAAQCCEHEACRLAAVIETDSTRTTTQLRNCADLVNTEVRS